MTKPLLRSEIILENLPSWEKALRLFEKTTGLTTSLYLASGVRVLGPFSSTPMGVHMIECRVFEDGGIAQRAEVDELIPILTLKEGRIKLFADALTILGIPVRIDNEVVGVIYAGWVFDHFADPIECERLSRLFGTSGVNLWQIARMQAPVSPEKLKIYQEMIELMVSTMTEQLVSMRELRHASKIKDEILALVSHELKTPLTSLLLRVQMLKNHKVSDEKMKTFISSMESSTLVQSKMVDDLLDAAQIATGKFNVSHTDMDLKDLLKESMELLSSQGLGKNLSMSLVDIGGDYRFSGDPLRLRQAFLNLLLNSIKFTRDGGKISVSLTRNLTNFHIQITDNGDGIEESFFPALFERFSQQKAIVNSKAGLGLGLFIAKKIFELHGGSIEIHSEGKGKGTVCEIILPHKN